ncbi:gamma-glutamylcyclotransferase [Clostridia bacterium]|nr:gamma-glutamylcyclotransferase [Clostridia bacterium]
MKRKIYIAYGSNLNLEQMEYRCPTAKVVGNGKLKGYQLLFRGGHDNAVATVEPCRDGTVPVLAWTVTPADEAALDRYEGYPDFYRKEMVEIEMNGKTVKAMVYIMNEGHPLGQPNGYYYGIIREGYKSAGFDLNVLIKATEDSVG